MQISGLERNLADEQKNILKGVLLKSEKYTFRKLFKFVNENIPEQFWSETDDDAKPEYLKITISGSGESIKCSDNSILSLDKIGKEHLKKTLRRVYDARSKLVLKAFDFQSTL